MVIGKLKYPHAENMVIGKLKYLMDPAVEHTPHCLVGSRTGAGHPRAVGLFHARGKRGKVAWVISFRCVCLGLPGQVNKFDSNRPSLTNIETA